MKSEKLNYEGAVWSGKPNETPQVFTFHAKSRDEASDHIAHHKMAVGAAQAAYRKLGAIRWVFV